MATIKVGRFHPYANGGGVQEGFDCYKDDMDSPMFLPAEWKPSGDVCGVCGERLEKADVSRGHFFYLWRCPNGHTFSYQNTC